jgi:hypothetical protein
MSNLYKYLNMKRAKKLLTIIAILISGYCSGQQPTLTIDEYKSQDFKQFDGDGVFITSKLVQEGFTLRVKSSTLIDKVELKKGGVFSANNLPIATSDANYSKIYIGVRPTIVSGIVEIQLTRIGYSPVIVKLIVEENKTTHLIKSQPCKKEYENNFGEDLNYYDKDKVVYIYDFNTDPSLREFYKITKVDGKLKTDFVNFNTEVLKPWNNVKFKIFNINRFMYDVSHLFCSIAFF